MNLNVKFLYTKAFMQSWHACGLSIEDRDELEDEIISFLTNLPANNHGRKFPGAIIQDTGGAIKYRFAPKRSNEGKSGSYRTIYFTTDKHFKYFMFVDVYSKNKQESLSNKQKNELKKFSKHINNFIK